MKILSIETSCDETAISLVKAFGGLESPSFSVLGNALSSQMHIHKEYGGVYPMIAKRKHAKNLIPVLKKVLIESSMFIEITKNIDEKKWKEIKIILSKEYGLYNEMKNVLEKIKTPDIEVISVTSGPGLAPALWVGISFAKALGKLWNIPVVGVNHMEGHIASVLMNRTEEFSISNFQFSKKINFPAIALLISGGHTELVKIDDWGKYNIIGETMDDAVGEAFDKVARMIALPYPGGPEISKLAEYAKENNVTSKAKFPRPMLQSKDFNFSFSGLKTSVLYYIRDNFHIDVKSQQIITRGLREDDAIPLEDRADIAREFEDSVVEVLLSKTKKALDETQAKTLIIAGGVIANKKLRESFLDLEKKYFGLMVKIPTITLATDNSLMIAGATYINICIKANILSNQREIIAKSNLRLGENI